MEIELEDHGDFVIYFPVKAEHSREPEPEPVPEPSQPRREYSDEFLMKAYEYRYRNGRVTTQERVDGKWLDTYLCCDLRSKDRTIFRVADRDTALDWCSDIKNPAYRTPYCP